jgi:uncharacterized membrane protein YqjE
MASGPLDALRRVSANSLALLHSRFELATLELAQARRQLVRWLLLALIGSLVVQLALLALAGAVMAFLWESAGPFALLGLAVVYAGIGAAIVWRLQREIVRAPSLFSATLSELAKDREAVFGVEPVAENQSIGEAHANPSHAQMAATESSSHGAS